MSEEEHVHCITQIDTNRISFTGEINDKTVSKLLASLTECIKQQPYGLHAVDKPTIFLHLHTTGGCLYSGLRAYDMIKLLRNRCIITTIADGIVASAGTLILLAGTERMSLRNTWFLFHQLSTNVTGKNCDVQDEAENCKRMMRQMIRIYTKETNLSRADVKRLLLKEVNISAKQVKAWGVISGIL